MSTSSSAPKGLSGFTLMDTSSSAAYVVGGAPEFFSRWKYSAGRFACHGKDPKGAGSNGGTRGRHLAGSPRNLVGSRQSREMTSSAHRQVHTRDIAGTRKPSDYVSAVLRNTDSTQRDFS